MLSRQNQVKKLLQEYDQKRMAAHKALEDRKAHIYEEIPEIKALDDELAASGIKIAKMILESPEKQELMTKELYLNTKKLNARKEFLLKQHDFTLDCMEMSYECDLCQDTGFIGQKKCRCLEQKLINLSYNQANVRKIVEEENFSNFDLNFYSTEVMPPYNRSPYENMILIHNHIVKFIDLFKNKPQNFLFLGETGLGKTFLCNCIAKEILDKGHTVLYLTAFELFQVLSKNKFNYDTDKEEDEIIKDTFNSIFNADLLIIDDLGTEFQNSFTNVEFFNCINTRILHKKSTIISTNYAMDEIKANYSDRIVSRLIGHYKIMPFYGSDIRLQKIYNK